MPRNFTPSSRAVVMERTEEMTGVFDAAPLGNGVVAVFRSDYNQSTGWTSLTEKHGWYVDRIMPDDDGDMVALMPITEVPE